MIEKPKVCAFDIGNVLLKVESNRRNERVLLYGSKKGYSSLPENLTRGLRLGHMDETTYVSFVADNLGITEKQVLDAELAMLGEIDWEMVSLARSLFDTGIRTVAVSNNQPIHWRHLRNIIPFKDAFHCLYLSHELNIEKPDPELFRVVTEIEAVCPEDIILIDDEENIIQAAVEFGWLESIVHISTDATIKYIKRKFWLDQQIG